MHAPGTGEGREEDQASVAGRRQAAKNTPRLGMGRVGFGKLVNNAGEGEHGLTLAGGEDDQGTARTNKRNG